MALIDDLFAPPPPPPPGIDHRCLACGQHHPGAEEVHLVDGTVVSTHSEAWRHECEARAILQIPRLWDRQQHLARTEKLRGKKTADALKNTMLAIWDAQQKNNAA